ncbi:DnaB-like helicase C-terminal domain-containing protein [Desulfomonile tiedjei]|uniref:DNA 5'-3' helicase n=1 Tax=Desulfomonile tiedjei (strain ATCC 49306 / DSM 6799 / DCB-1) TaxID=706587 RepID=I4C6S9_DESTA|nr:DnaB-like helicase C-terminal domain-containing protein [Desulfomonile tiedjei]AFM25270.1 replicative DNA helicase [Desulfomonile tiedjei DSM 6799]
MSKELEAKVLVALLSDRYLLSRVMSDGFSPDIFADPNYKIIFKTAYEMSQLPGQVVDWITIESNLKNRNWLTPELIQAISVLKTDVVPEADQMMAYVEILKDRGLREKTLKLSQVMANYALGKGQYQDQDFLDFSSRIIQTLIELQKQKVKKRITPLKETIREINETTNRPRVEKKLLGFSIYPHERLEHLLSGIRKGFYYGIAGPPRRGKTTFALDLASRLAEKNRFPVLFYTWEQTRKTLAARLLGRECYINPVKLLTEVNPEEQQRHALVQKVIERSQAYSNHLFVIEAGRQDTIERIKAQAYNVMHEFRTNHISIFFDYLQKIPLGRQYEDIRGQVNEASAQLADLSLELECPVFAISAMDKEGCKLDEKPPSYDEFSTTLYARPTMHNCVGGGDLEYDLDVAMVLSKDWIATKNLHDRLSIKGKEAKMPDLPQIDIINLHIDKNRDSAGESSPTIQYAFFININKFVEVGYKTEEEYTKEFKGFAKAEDMFGTLLDTGIFKL